jgi:16S rRNA pseudouridine516 synthase
MKALKLLANLGYGSRKEVDAMFERGRVTDADGRALAADEEIDARQIRVDGEELDPLPGLVLMLHKPVGYTCSTSDAGQIVYDLLPPRFRLRKPMLSSVGRLDRDTSGLLLMTDDGALLHRIVSPRTEIAKVYEVTLARPLRGDEPAAFASGTLMLRSEETPLAPAVMEIINERQARLTISEGRYHQVRRMFAALGNHVAALHRSRIGELTLGDLAAGQWRALDVAQVRLVVDRATPDHS